MGRSASRIHINERGRPALRNHKLLISRLLAAAVLLLTALLRASAFLPSFGRAFLLLPAIICLAMFDDVIPSLLFALVFGAVWDASSVGRDGVYTLFCGIAAVAVCLCVRYYLRRKTATALLLNAVAVVLTFAVSFLIADGSGRDALLPALTRGLPAAIVAFAVSPLYYLIYKRIYSSALVRADMRTFRIPEKKR